MEVIQLKAGGESDAMDSSANTVIVRLTDENGLAGIGEADAPASVVESFLEMPTEHVWSQNPRSLLLGSDPVEITALWERLYLATSYPGRRGLGIHALSAVDIALHDLAGKQLGLPAYKLMGGARRTKLRPYCTIYPGLPKEDLTLNNLTDAALGQCETALGLGFRTLKLELMFGELASDADLVDVVRQVRHSLGGNITLALDFGYRWYDPFDAAWVLNRLGDEQIYFAEAALQHDDLRGHAELSRRCPIRICGAEFAATRWEIREWIETAKVAVVQPDISRCGGLTEIRRIADMCELHGVQLIPHGWKTGILAQAGRHFQASCPAAPLFEFFSPHVYPSPLRQSLVGPEPTLSDGYVSLPEGPGLGLTLDEDIVNLYRV